MILGQALNISCCLFVPVLCDSMQQGNINHKSFVLKRVLGDLLMWCLEDTENNGTFACVLDGRNPVVHKPSAKQQQHSIHRNKKAFAIKNTADIS